MQPHPSLASLVAIGLVSGIAAGAAALVSASAATYHVATLRMRKISLRRLLKR